MGVATLSTALAAGGAVVAYVAYTVLDGLREGIRGAERSGLKYIVSPISPFWIPGLLTFKLWSPFVKCLPKSWWEEWMIFLTPDWSYRHNHAVFATDPAILIVSPFSTVVLTDNAELIRQITSRREHFPKDTESYSVLTQFGDNVLTSEGAAWKLHRKVTSTAFGERNAALVFDVAAEQTRGLLEKWVADQGGDGGGRGEGEGEGGGEEENEKKEKSIVGGGGGSPVKTIDHDTMRLALNIIGYVGFGLRLLWPGQKLPEGTDPGLYKYSALEPAEGHTMSFVDAVEGMLDMILVLLIVPEWLLRRLPFQKARFAAECHRNFLTYMHELLDEKIDQVSRGDTSATPGMDMMGHLVRSTYPAAAPGSPPTSTSTTSPVPVPTTPADPPADGDPGTLTKSDIIGNAFIVLVAGHETTANALHFTLLELAAHPASQRALQRDIDRILGARTDPGTWCYEEVIGPLLGGMAGACMSETLRKLPSVVEIPKCVDSEGAVGGRYQVVTVDGEAKMLPVGAKISLVAVAAHRNPRNWPTRASRISGAETDLDDYVPERWFRRAPGDYTAGSDGGSTAPTTPATPASSWSQESVFTRGGGDAGTPGSSVVDEEGGEGDTGVDGTSSLFRPEKGAFLAFSEGPRACLGRRIAQVEIVAVLAVIFQRYSLELAVDDFLPGAGEEDRADVDVDEVVAGMDREAREAVYRAAQERCRQRILGASTVLTLKMQGGQDVPVRLVRRGEERFVSWVD